VNVTKPHP